MGQAYASRRVNAIDSALRNGQGKHRFLVSSGPISEETPNRGKTRARHQASVRHCGTKFYDLSKNPIVCPKCAHGLPVTHAVGRARRAPKPLPLRPPALLCRPQKAVADVAETAEIEFVSLEDADAEATARPRLRRRGRRRRRRYRRTRARRRRLHRRGRGRRRRRHRHRRRRTRRRRGNLTGSVIGGRLFSATI